MNLIETMSKARRETEHTGANKLLYLIDTFRRYRAQKKFNRPFTTKE